MIFENINKKSAFKIATLGFFLSGFLYNKDFGFESIMYETGKQALILFILGFMFFLIATRFHFKFPLDNRKYLIQKFIFILLYILSSLVFVSLFPLLSIYFKLIYLFATSFGFYLLLLAINVFIVSEEKGSLIPLVQPSLMVMSLAFLSVVFLGTTIIYKFDFFSTLPSINLLAKLILFISFFYVLFFSIFWYVVSGYNKVGQFTVDLIRVNWSLVMSFVALSQIAYLLSFVPLESYGRALILTSYAYVLLVFAQLYSRHLFVRREAVKFVAIIFSVYLLVYFM